MNSISSNINIDETALKNLILDEMRAIQQWRLRRATSFLGQGVDVQIQMVITVDEADFLLPSDQPPITFGSSEIETLRAKVKTLRAGLRKLADGREVRCDDGSTVMVDWDNPGEIAEQTLAAAEG